MAQSFEGTPLLADDDPPYLWFRARTSAFYFTMVLVAAAIIVKEGINANLTASLPALHNITGSTSVLSLPSVNTGFYAAGKFCQILSVYLFGGKGTIVASALLVAVGQQHARLGHP